MENVTQQRFSQMVTLSGTRMMLLLLLSMGVLLCSAEQVPAEEYYAPEIDFSSVLYHWDRSSDWVEGLDNNYIGLTVPLYHPPSYVKAAGFTNSYGDAGGILGLGTYLDDTGRYWQGIEAGLTWGYRDDQGFPIFAGYSGKYQFDEVLSGKVHVNPEFVGVYLSIKFSFFQ